MQILLIFLIPNCLYFLYQIIWETEQNRQAVMLEEVMPGDKEKVAESNTDEICLQVSDHNSMSERDASSLKVSENEETKGQDATIYKGTLVK